MQKRLFWIKLKEGIITKLGVLMSDESRLVVSSAQKDSKKYKKLYIKTLVIQDVKTVRIIKVLLED